jgi:hypothetical protein
VAWRIRTTMDENKIKGEKEEVFQEELVELSRKSQMIAMDIASVIVPLSSAHSLLHLPPYPVRSLLLH